MIILAGVGVLAIVLYFVGTWLYTSRQQDALRDELAADNPELAATAATVDEGDFITVGSIIQGAVEAERQAELAALEAAAEEYLPQVLGRPAKAMGKLVIPKIGVDTIMVQGNFQGYPDGYLRKGPGHWPETPLPGQGGSVVISGHRSTYGAPFRKIDALVPGDVIELTMPYAILRYKVTQVIVVAPDEVQVVAYQGKEMISLVACHPLYSAKQRIIAQADLSSFVLLDAAQ
jgi:LPXTG-site transpeptidase (sortase) family protein